MLTSHFRDLDNRLVDARQSRLATPEGVKIFSIIVRLRPDRRGAYGTPVIVLIPRRQNQQQVFAYRTGFLAVGAKELCRLKTLVLMLFRHHRFSTRRSKPELFP